MAITRYGVLRFLKVRLTRIVVPLVATAVTLNTLQSYVVGRHNGANQSLTGLFLSPMYWWSGKWVSHLWFLNCLVVFFLATALIYALLGSSLAALGERLRSFRWIVASGLYIVVVPAVLIIADLLGARFEGTVRHVIGFLDAHDLAHNAVFFAFGFLMGAYPKLMDDFPKPRPWALVLTMLLAVVTILFAADVDASVRERLLLRYSSAYFSCYLCVICFYVFRRWFNFRSTVFAYLSDASYSVYLFHHFWVVAVGILVISLPLPMYAKFTMLVAAAGAIALAMHHFGVLRSPALRYLFNGKTPAEARKSIKAVHA
jgi:glucan biosynthesis protein C